MYRRRYSEKTVNEVTSYRLINKINFTEFDQENECD